MKNKENLCKKRNFKKFGPSLFYLPSNEVDVESTVEFSALTWSNQLCVKRLSRFVPKDVLLKVLSKLYCQFCTMVQLFGLIVPRLSPKSLKDFRIKLCALRSRSKKVLKTEAQKGWSTLAKKSHEIPTFSTGLQDCT